MLGTQAYKGTHTRNEKLYSCLRGARTRLRQCRGNNLWSSCNANFISSLKYQYGTSRHPATGKGHAPILGRQHFFVDSWSHTWHSWENVTLCCRGATLLALWATNSAPALAGHKSDPPTLSYNSKARFLLSAERRHKPQEMNQDSPSFSQEKKQTTRNESGSLVLFSFSKTGSTTMYGEHETARALHRCRKFHHDSSGNLRAHITYLPI